MGIIAILQCGIISLVFLLASFSLCEGDHLEKTLEINNNTMDLSINTRLPSIQEKRGDIIASTMGNLDEKSIVGITVSSSMIPMHTIFPVSVYIDPTEAIGGWKVDVAYSSEHLNLSSVSLGGWWRNATFSSLGNTSIPGILRGVQACCNSNYTYPNINHTGFIIEFESIAPGSCEITVRNVTVTNTSFNVLPVITRNVSLHINQYPVALNDTKTTLEDTSLLIDVLENDYDLEDGKPSLESITVFPTNGTVEIDNGFVQYEPQANFFGNDSFQYRVVDSGGLYATAWVFITVERVNDPPEANFSYSPFNPFSQETIQFTDLSTDIDGTLISWSWDFGDGNFSSQQNPLHVYSYGGRYLVTLNVTDNNGAFNSIGRDIEVAPHINLAPEVTMINPPESSVDIERPPANITVTIKDPDGDLMDLAIRSVRYIPGYLTEWYVLTTFEDVGNGSYQVIPSGNDWVWGNTTYSWGINLTDGNSWVNKTYTFSTSGSRYDVNNDDKVNFVDAGIVWVHRTTNAVYDGIYDVNGDGTVNFVDAGLTWVHRD
jgi:PKD repeat protein